MLFSNPSFLFFFLPLVLLAYFGLGRRCRDLVLVVFSLIFYAWGERIYTVALLVSILLNWGSALMLGGGKQSPLARRVLPLAVGANLLMLACLKYANFIVDNINSALGLLHIGPIHLAPVHLPIGISFFAFQGMSYLIDVYRGHCPPQKSLIKMAMYKSFFPQLIAGPIVRYVDIKAQVENRTVTGEDFAVGVQRFIIGLAKKMMIANVVARPVDQIFALPADQLTTGLAWLAIVGYALQIYFDFSAYSDMAIGLGRMFGFRFLENFNYPYIAGSMTDFWRRWHISLSTWFRDYLYIPLGGNRVPPWRNYCNLLFVFFLCGLWHGASWNFIIWGLMHGVFLMLERVQWLAPVRVESRPLRHAYVILTVLVTWVFFRAETLGASITFLSAMAGFARTASVVPTLRMYVDHEVALAFAAGIVGAMPVYPWAAQKFSRLKARGMAITLPIESVQFAALVLIYFYSVMLMAAGSYSPFIYFRF